MIEQSHEEVVEGMMADPEGWAELYLQQNQVIHELEGIIEQYKARIEMLLRKPEDLDH